MQQYRKNLGKVSLTAEGAWNLNNNYDILSIVYDEHTQHGFISRKAVPQGIDLYNKEYWMPLNVSGYADNNVIILSKKTSEASIRSYTLEEAIVSIKFVGRRPGAILGFYNENADRLDIGGRWELWQFNDTNIYNWENIDSWQNLYYNYNKFMGWFKDENFLTKYAPFPEIGCYAFVGSEFNEATVYRCDNKYVWNNTTQHAWDYVKVIIDGNVTIGENGNWFNNGEDTGIPASVKGENGKTPIFREKDNAIQYSFDNINWITIIDKVAAWFRWNATIGDTQANNVGRIQISRDNITWTNLSGDIINNLHISRYIGGDETLPTSGIAEGTIYAKGPTYADEDTSHANPIYRLWVYAWKNNTLAWQDNGEFTSIAAGIVQETGTSETEVMSQKAVTNELSKTVSKKIGKNLIDVESENIVHNKLLYNGIESDSDKYNISDYIRVDENTEYCYSISNTNESVITPGAGIAFYNSSKELLSYSQGSTGSKVVYTTPNECYYIRLSIYKSTAKYDVQFEKGNGRSEYEPYSLIAGYANIDKIKERIDLLSNEIYTYTIVEHSNIRPNKEFSTLYYIKDSEVNDIVEYNEIPSRTKLRIFVENNNTTKAVRFYKLNSFVSTNEFVDIPIHTNSNNDIIVPEEYNYLKVCVDTGTIPNVCIISTTKETINEVENNISLLKEDLYIENPEKELLIRPNREFSNLYYLVKSENSNIYDYGKLSSGIKLRVYVENTNTSSLVRFYTTYTYISTTQFVEVSVKSGIVNEIVVPDGYNYLKICSDKDAKPIVNIISSTKEVLIEINKNEKLINQAASIVGNNVSRNYIESLKDGESLVLNNFPLHCKKGLAMSMAADIKSFNKIIFGKGYEKYRGRWLEIDNHKVVLKGYESATYTIESVEHGLDINTVIKASLACDYEGKCKVIVMTLGGMFSHVFNWGYDGNYEAMVLSLGSELNNVYINATTTDFRQPIWFFGASYLGVNKNRLLGQLKEIGYFNYLIDNLAGMGSNEAYNDLVSCLNYGTPKFLVWCLGFNDYTNQNIAISVAEKVSSLCEEKNITLLFSVYASVPGRNMTEYQKWLRDSGYRLIDIDKAVGSPIYESGVNNWYDGYLSTDNVHPTELGAKAMAMQLLIDFPEIMQYGLYKDDVVLDNTETDK